MKKMKMTAAMTAAMLTLAGLPALDTGAAYTEIPSANINEQIEGWTVLNDCGALADLAKGTWYYKEGSFEGSLNIRSIDVKNDTVYIEMDGEVDLDALNAIVSEIDPQLAISHKDLNMYRLEAPECNYPDFETKAALIYNAIRDKAELVRYEVHFDTVVPTDGYYYIKNRTHEFTLSYLTPAVIENLTSQGYTVSERELELSAALPDSVAAITAEAEGDYRIEITEQTIGNIMSSGLTVYPGEDVPLEEVLQVVGRIYTETKVRPNASAMASFVDNSTSIDMYNAVDGDANNDNELTIADAAAVLQYLANKDKYGLTAQGRFNADMECRGISTATAVEIQKRCARQPHENS